MAVCQECAKGSYSIRSNPRPHTSKCIVEFAIISVESWFLTECERIEKIQANKGCIMINEFHSIVSRIIILSCIVSILSACGSPENNTDTTVKTDPNISKIIGTWYLPNGCPYGPETALITINASSSAENNISIFYSYYEEDTKQTYDQSISNIEILKSITTNGDISYQLAPELNSNSNGPDDLLINRNDFALLLSKNNLEVYSACSSTQDASFIDKSGLLNLLRNRLAQEISDIRNYYKSQFDNNWTVTYTDLARRGMLGTSLVCSERLGLVKDYLSNLMPALSQNASKYTIFSPELSSTWANSTYEIIYNLDLAELPLPDTQPWSASNCDPVTITTEIEQNYTSGLYSVLN